MSDLSAQLGAAGFKPGAKTDEQAKKEEGRQAAEEQRRSMLSSILQPSARERLNRVALVKPDNARAVEDHLLRLAQARKLGAPVSEDDVIRILEEVTRMAGGGGAGAKVKIARKRRADEDESADDDDDL